VSRGLSVVNWKKILSVVTLLASENEEPTDENESEENENQKGDHHVEHCV
jgi:hypothetical protein